MFNLFEILCSASYNSHYYSLQNFICNMNIISVVSHKGWHTCKVGDIWLQREIQLAN